MSTISPELVKQCFLGITAATITTMSFQLATNPPGGVVQASLSDKGLCSNQGTYVAFLISNTISFIASLGVFLVSVIYLKPVIPTNLIQPLSIGLYIAVASLALTYLFATSMVTLTSIWASVGVVVNVSLAVIVIYYIIHSLSTLSAQPAQPQPQPVQPQQ